MNTPLFSPEQTCDALNTFSKNTMVSTLGITFTEVGTDYLKATMPVSDHTRQPLGLLHGGASVTLAETLGSVAAHLIVASQGRRAVGLEISANHIRAVKEGTVTGTARPLHVGKSTHLWEIKINDDQDRLVCVSKITMAILDPHLGEAK